MTLEPTTILVVDDEEANREILARRLERKGYRVLEAPDGFAALAAVERGAIDLVLLDVMMPGIDGLEVLKRLREKHSAQQLPVIMVTAKSDSQDIVQALELGANDYIAKPIDFAVTLARIQLQLRSAPKKGPGEAPPEALPTEPKKLGPGSVLGGKYLLESRIGSGSFGTVFQARHIDLDSGVAIKILQTESSATAEDRVRFQREGISACRVRHPNAVAVIDFGVERHTIYLVMELLTGHSLEDELARFGRLSLARTAEIALPVCSVLAESHRLGVVHRDIKPANVYLHRLPQGETVKVLDFGIAKLADDPAMTLTGMVLGTPAYMAPERFMGALCVGSSDIYSLGTMLYQMLVGRLPFVPTARDPMVLADMKLKDDPQPLRQINPEVPEAVQDLVMRTLSRAPEARPSALELAQSLSAIVGVPLQSSYGPGFAAANVSGPIEEEKPTEVFPAKTE
jgi:CheY-like chemotaxis protein